MMRLFKKKSVGKRIRFLKRKGRERERERERGGKEL